MKQKQGWMGRVLFFRIARIWVCFQLMEEELEKMRVREDRGSQGGMQEGGFT